MKRKLKNKSIGFTLVELLVALAILGVIVVVCGKIFQQSNIAWQTGSLKAEGNLVGRGVADFIAQDISRCVISPSTPNPTKFEVVNESGPTNANWPRETITYSLKPLRRNGEQLAPDNYIPIPVELIYSAAGGYVDVIVTVQVTENTADRKVFKSRAWLINTDRYKYDN
jgi:prepilin-type N-terminal cleavage/methylation domain-containing protein